MSALETIGARPIHYTSHPADLVARLEPMGLVRVDGTPEDPWQVFRAPGGGDLALHHVEPGDPLDGTSQLGFEADDLDAVLAELPDTVRAELVQEAHGPTLRITAPDGLAFLVDSRPQRTVPAAADLPYRLEVSQMWFTGEGAGAHPVLSALGAQTLVTSPEGSGWVDLRMPAGGRTQVHHKQTAPYVSAGFNLAGSLEALRDRLHAAGFEAAAIVDESYGRYLELEPGGLDVELGWVNAEQDDYYGYVVHRDPEAAQS